MKDILLICIGGGLGSGLRFIISRWLQSWSTLFPWGTLTVNILACLILGIIVGLIDHRQALSPAGRLFWMAGFCGGFSTFSTFSQEAFSLFQMGELFYASLYIIASMTFCLVTLAMGWYFGQQI